MPAPVESSIQVTSEDPKKKDEKDKDKEEGSSKLTKDSKEKKKDGKDDEEGEELVRVFMSEWAGTDGMLVGRGSAAQK
jgi:hypothetical protein